MSSASDGFPVGDYESLTNDWGVGQLSDWSVITLTGGDRSSFLHNMCTNDISGLGEGAGCEAFFTDVQGKIIAHCLVISRRTDLLLLSVPEVSQTIVSHLERYIIREDVQLSDDSNSFQWLICGGKNVHKSLGKFFDEGAGDLVVPWNNCVWNGPDWEATVVNCPVLWPGALLVGSSASHIDHLLEIFQSHGGSVCSSAAWQTLRLESGFPLLNVDFDHANLPQEVNRDEQAISFQKGCYLGQETVARIDALGHVNRKLVTVKFDSPATPEVGLAFFSGEKQIGVVTSWSWSPRAKAMLGLAMVRREACEIGNQLSSDAGPAVVIDSPAFASPEH